MSYAEDIGMQDGGTPAWRGGVTLGRIVAAPLSQYTHAHSSGG
jgi:hypothetical protein